MKRLIIMIAAVLLGASVAKAGQGFQLPSSVYTGGVKYATAAHTAIYSTGTLNGPAVFYGVSFSTGLCGDLDYVDVFDSTTAAVLRPGVDAPYERLYNVNTSTTGGRACSGFSGPAYPVVYNKGIVFKPNVATYNMIRLYYWRED